MKNIENMENKNNVLSFENFTKKIKGNIPYYNNFIAYFSQGIFLDVYKNTPHAIRFQKENPELYKILCEKIQKITTKDEGDIEIKRKDTEPELYEAYKIMKSYGVSDEDLFR